MPQPHELGHPRWNSSAGTMASEHPVTGEDEGDDDDTNILEELPDELEERFAIHEEMEALNARVDEIREEMIHPRAVRMVLEDAGLSESRAGDLIETMQEVDRRTRADESE